MAGEQQFRSAMLGGFQKQDVLNYIESSTREHSAKVETLQKELNEARAARAALETEKETLCAEHAAASAKLEEITAKLEETAAACDRAKAELEGKDARLAQMEEEKTILKAQAAELEPQAKAYQAVKDRAAGIELEAHIRAQAAEGVARERVKETKAELEKWIINVQAEYEHLRLDVDATISHAVGELERVEKCLEGISTGFTDHDAELERLLQSYRQPHVPTPLKVDGD